MTGTRYHFADTYSELIRRGAAKLRLYTATVDGTFDGEPVLWTRDQLKRKIREQGTYIASCQLFNNPVMEGEETFKEEWIQYWIPRGWDRMNRYIIVDPANEKKKSSDYTVMIVYGLGSDHNYYIIDMVRDKLSMHERAQRLFALHSEYRPLSVGYEKYGMQSDIDYMKQKMESDQYRFNIVPLGGNMAKNDRIKRLQPILQDKRLYIPEKMMRVDYQGRTWDLVHSFIQDEYLQFPYMTHDDMLDCAARITDDDLNAFFPQPSKNGGLPAWVGEEEGTEYDFDTFGYLRA